jgi:hypothetical protein
MRKVNDVRDAVGRAIALTHALPTPLFQELQVETDGDGSLLVSDDDGKCWEVRITEVVLSDDLSELRYSCTQ